MKHRLPKPTLQKLNAEDDVEHFLETFERIAKTAKLARGGVADTASWTTDGESDGSVCGPVDDGLNGVRESEEGDSEEVPSKRRDASTEVSAGPKKG